MGYCSEALVLWGVIFDAMLTRGLFEEHLRVHDIKPACDRDLWDEYAAWFGELCRDIEGLEVRDLTRHEEYCHGRDHVPFWQRKFAITRRQALLQTEFWGHSACAEATATVPLHQASVSEAERAAMDAALQALALAPTTAFPTQLILYHHGG
jgi:hypothetical protein